MLLASGPVAGISPRASAIALAEGFAEQAQVAVIGLADSGPALAQVVTEPDGEVERLSSGWVARDDDLLLVGSDPEAALDPLGGSSAALGRLVAYALSGGTPQRVVVDLTGPYSHDAGAGFLAELAPYAEALRAGDLVGVVAPGEQTDLLLGLRGITSRRGRTHGVPADQMLAVDAALERFAADTAPDQAKTEGAGAAGGLGFAILALGGRLATGAVLSAEVARLDRALAAADLVVTGCDSFDFGSGGGGVVAELGRRCATFQVPLVVVSPVVGISGREMRTLGVESAHPTTPGAEPAAALTATARRLADGWVPRW